jgi:putative addiction module killer protein
MSFTVVEYIGEDGSNRYRDWFDGLDPRAAAKIAAAIVRLEMGNMSRVKWIGRIAEYRIDWGPGYRIYLTKDRNALIVLFGGGTKRSQRVDIRRAEGVIRGVQDAQSCSRENQRW